MLRISVGGERDREEIPLLGASGHARGGSRTLYVEDNGRYLGVISQAEELVHQREPGPARGRKRTSTHPAGAQHHTDCSEFVLRLDDAVQVLAGLRILAEPRAEASEGVHEGRRGVIGYHAATVAPAYTQPKAAAMFPVINTESRFASIASSRIGSRPSKCSVA